MGSEIKYDAFISYRHCEPDGFVAKKLHEMLESYKPPKKLKKNAAISKSKITRVFRDKDELPLTNNLEDPLMKALANSEFLIVICSPRLKESVWCRKEIETFISMHGRQNVLAVLIEGEPEDSFPEELKYDYEPVTAADGTVEYHKRKVEPLAADIRGSTKKEMKKAMKEEILRLLAPMLGVNYDDLKQRQRERKMKRMFGSASIIAVSSVLLGCYFALTAMQIKAQNNIILTQSQTLSNQADKLLEQATILETQNESLKREQAISLSKEAAELFAKDNRYDAVRLAYEAMTERNGVSFPDTAEAQKVLTMSLGIYDAGLLISARDQIETPGIVQSMQLSPNAAYLLVSDNLGNLTLWDTETRNLLTTINLNRSQRNALRSDDKNSGYGFLNEAAFYYLSEDSHVVKVDIATSEQTALELPATALQTILNVTASIDGNRLYARTMTSIYVIDAVTMTVETQLPCSFAPNQNELFVSEAPDEFYCFLNDEETNNLIFYGIDSISGETHFSTNAIKGTIVRCLSVNNTLYVTSYEYANNFNELSHVVALDKTTGSILWEKEELGYMASDLYYTVSSDRECLLCTFDNLVWLIDANTGETIVSMTLTGDILYCNQSRGDFLAYDSAGNCSVLSNNPDHLLFELSTVNCTELSLLTMGKGLLLGVPDGENRVVFYSYRKNESAALYEGAIAEPLIPGSHEDSVNLNWATENRLPKASYIVSYLELPEINKTFVSYLDNTLEVYQSDSMELLYTYDIEYSRLDYLGNEQDYYILTNSISGLFFNKNGELCADIDLFHGLTEDRKQMVLYGRDETSAKHYFSLPIYSLEELKDKARDYLNN